VPCLTEATSDNTSDGTGLCAAGEEAADRTIGQRWAHFEQCAGLTRLAALRDSVAGLLGQLSTLADDPGAAAE